MNSVNGSNRYSNFPVDFFARADDGLDATFYSSPRFVAHIDEAAITCIGKLYEELEISGAVLDLMSSWISHFTTTPKELVALGMNEQELQQNPAAASWVQQDLNVNTVLPFADSSFDAVVCCVSVDYLTKPLEVFDEVHRVLRPGGKFVNTFSNRCFPTKAINGWSRTDDEGHATIVGEYYRLTGPWENLQAQRRTQSGHQGDPVYAVWADAT
ncbi:MAG: SAM-dependent methyltransferase [Candidatus Poriferisodalaceae bacterium]|jgi:SAM-dependent methyltransferase|tara:strand:+ start:976 stop:1614 length:639 start_codon:yes stop_codon:yes gene_type:complete